MKKSITTIGVIVCACVLAGCHFLDMQSKTAPQQKHPQNIIDEKNSTKKDVRDITTPNENTQMEENIQKNEKTVSNGEKSDSVTISVPYIFGEGDIGCGVGIKFVSYQVPYTKGVLNAVYTKLFDRSQDIAPEYRNTVQAYELTYDSVTLSDGVARVYLSGNMYGPDHCALPELQELIDQAAFQFDTVDTVMVYLNGEIYDWCEKDVSGGETGCPAEKQLWIDKKEK